MENTRSAFITRVNPAGCVNNLPDTLYRNQVSIGWAYLEPDNFMNDNDEERLKLIKKELQRVYTQDTPKVAKLKSKQINYFFSIKKGDLISWIQLRSATDVKLDFTSRGVLKPSTFLGRLFKLSSID